MIKFSRGSTRSVQVRPVVKASATFSGDIQRRNGIGSGPDPGLDIERVHRVLRLKGQGVHAPHDVDCIAGFDVDQAEVDDHGGEVGEGRVIVAGDVINFAADDCTTSTAKTSEKINFAVNMTRLKQKRVF